MEQLEKPISRFHLLVEDKLLKVAFAGPDLKCLHVPVAATVASAASAAAAAAATAELLGLHQEQR